MPQIPALTASRIRAAIAFGIAATLASLGVFALVGLPIGEGWWMLPPTAGLAAALVASGIWPRCFRNRDSSVGRGAAVGIAIALLCYPVMWYALIVLFWLLSAITGQQRDVIPPWTAVPASLVYAAWGIVLTGWITLPIAAATGALCAVRDRRAAAHH